MAEMTPEKRAEAIFKRCASEKWGVIVQIIAEQIHSAVQAEREACQAVAESYGDLEIADAIRARGKERDPA